MADVSRWQRGGGRGRDRGQILLVAGLAVAVTLVALVLLLNTVIYSQNLAARGSAIEDDQAVAFQQEAAAGVGEIVVAENREEYDDWEEINESVRDAVARYDTLHSRYSAERGTVADVVDEEDPLSLSEGTLLRQRGDSRNFSPAGDDAPANWTLVEDAGDGPGPGVRNATFDVSRASLSDDYSSAFSVRLRDDTDPDGDTDEWRVYVYDRSGAITLAVKNGTGSVDPDVCSVSGPRARIDLTAGTINGSACPELDWAKGVSAPYDVEFWNPDAATGNYSMTVATPDGTAANVRTDNFEEPGAEASPRAVPAVYAAKFGVYFETPTLEYQTTVRVAPGEPE